MSHLRSVISGIGSYFPSRRVTNQDFLNHEFYTREGKKVEKSTENIVEKLRQISGIRERRYIGEEQDSASLAAEAARNALADAGMDGESLDGIIVAHNFGNILPGSSTGHLIPNLAAVMKGRLGISNPKIFAYDILFGCPGWLEAMIIAHQYLLNGRARHILVVGVEVISRILDPHDMDSMLFGDGAGAAVLSAVEEPGQGGVLSHLTFSHCNEELDFLRMGPSNNPEAEAMLSPKMNGQKVFRYGIEHMPKLINECLEMAEVSVHDVSKFLFHQANEKMILRIAENLLANQEVHGSASDLVPINVHYTGNSSVATIPTMIDLIKRGMMENHSIHEGDITVMASVGAGMHCNCMVYQF
jgi:3-oxoacyl-[acyl-carrier-protein] synthase-3